MTDSDIPFALPITMDPSLTRVLAYWQGLKRAEATMPFWDDVKLSSLPDLAGELLLIDAFNQPERFRFNTVGAKIAQRHGDPVVGKFLADVVLHRPFRFLRAQCSATVEARAPTYYRDASGRASRLLLPMWGDGRISMLLGAITWA
jgi:hypothetical protein